MNQPEERQNGGAWLGILIFALVVGSQFLPGILGLLSGILGQQTSQQISSSLSGLFPYAIVALMVISIIWSIVSGVIRAVNRNSGSTPTSTPRGTTISPTTLPDTTRLPPGIRMEIPREVNLAGLSLSKASEKQTTLPEGVNFGKLNRTDAFSAMYTLPRGVNMDIPRSRMLTQMGRQKPLTRAPGYDPIISPQVLTIMVLATILGAAAFGVLLLFTP